MQPVSAKSIKSLHVSEVRFLVQQPLGAMKSSLEETEGRTVLGTEADFFFRTSTNLFSSKLGSINSKEINDAAEHLAKLVEDHIAGILGTDRDPRLTIPEGIGNRGI